MGLLEGGRSQDSGWLFSRPLHVASSHGFAYGQRTSPVMAQRSWEHKRGGPGLLRPSAGTHNITATKSQEQPRCGMGRATRGVENGGVGGDWSTENGSPWCSQLVPAGILAKIQVPNSGQPNFKPTFSMTARLVVTQDLRRAGRRLNQWPESSGHPALRLTADAGSTFKRDFSCAQRNRKEREAPCLGQMVKCNR